MAARDKENRSRVGGFVWSFDDRRGEGLGYCVGVFRFVIEANGVIFRKWVLDVGWGKGSEWEQSPLAGETN